MEIFYSTIVYPGIIYLAHAGTRFRGGYCSLAWGSTDVSHMKCVANAREQGGDGCPMAQAVSRVPIKRTKTSARSSAVMTPPLHTQKCFSIDVRYVSAVARSSNYI
jgi:hypothetical protein